MSEEPMSHANWHLSAKDAEADRHGRCRCMDCACHHQHGDTRFCRFPRDLRLHHRAVRHRELRTARSGLFVRDVGFAWLRLLHPDLLEPVLERLGLWARSPVRRGVLRPEHLRRYLQRCACSEPPCSRLVQGLRN